MHRIVIVYRISIFLTWCAQCDTMHLVKEPEFDTISIHAIFSQNAVNGKFVNRAWWTRMALSKPGVVLRVNYGGEFKLHALIKLLLVFVTGNPGRFRNPGPSTSSTSLIMHERYLEIGALRALKQITLGHRTKTLFRFYELVILEAIKSFNK